MRLSLLTEHGGMLCCHYCGWLGRVKTSGTLSRAKRRIRSFRMFLQWSRTDAYKATSFLNGEIWGQRHEQDLNPSWVWKQIGSNVYQVWKEWLYLVTLCFLVRYLLEVFSEGLYMPSYTPQRSQGMRRRNKLWYQPSQGSFEQAVMYSQIQKHQRDCNRNDLILFLPRGAWSSVNVPVLELELQ